MSAATATPLLRVEEARARMSADLGPLPAETVSVRDALDRVLATDVSARLTLPPWENSAMDGFAVRAEDVAAAEPGAPVTLAVTGEVAAGHPPPGAVLPGTALRILTGGMLPEGADAIVPVEDTDAPPGAAELPHRVAVTRPVAPGQHVRRAGSDLRGGEPLLLRGDRLDPARCALLAAAGYGEVAVVGRPRVAILGTGDELVPPGTPLGPAQIPDSNSVGLAGQARALGAEVLELGVAPDVQDAVVERLRSGIETCDVVIVSGGVSVGAHDEVKAAFDVVGRIDLWRVAVQPGKPLAFGRARRDDGSEVLLFGLPGNPVSSFVTFELFARPVLRHLAGHRDPVGRPIVRARLAERVSTSQGRRAYLRVAVTRTEESPGWAATLSGGQGSHMLAALARSNGLAIVPEEVETIEAGTIVDVLRLDEECR
jgi:molybdopterin molybdotransferase